MRLRVRFKLFCKRCRETNQGSLASFQNFFKVRKDSISLSQVVLLLSLLTMIYFKNADSVRISTTVEPASDNKEFLKRYYDEVEIP